MDSVVINITEVVTPTTIYTTTPNTVARGGTTGQVLSKKTNADFNTEWRDESVSSVNGLTGNVDLSVQQTRGTTDLTFLRDTNYGIPDSPETGNITADITGAVLGVTNVVIHNSGSTPTFDSKFKKLSGSGDYVINVVNYIMCQYVNATEIIYSISQRT
jgi:hypothetical protein